MTTKTTKIAATTNNIFHNDPWFNILRQTYGYLSIPLYPYPWLSSSSSNDNRNRTIRWLNLFINTVINFFVFETLFPQQASNYYQELRTKYSHYTLFPMYLYLNFLLLRPVMIIGYWFLYQTRSNRLIRMMTRKDCFQIRLSNHRCYQWIISMILIQFLLLLLYRLNLIKELFEKFSFNSIRFLIVYFVYDSYSILTWSLLCYHQLLNILTLKCYLMAISIRPKSLDQNRFRIFIKSFEKFSNINFQLRNQLSPLWIIHLCNVCSSHFNTIIRIMIEGWQNRWHKIHRDILYTILWLILFYLNQKSLSLFDQIYNRIRQLISSKLIIVQRTNRNQIQRSSITNYQQQCRYEEFKLLKDDFKIIIYDGTLHIHSVLFVQLIAFIIHYVCIIILS